MILSKSRFPVRLLVLFFAAMFRVKSWGRRNAPLNPQRILIAHHLLLGDTLMLTPLLAKLRERYPHAQIVMTTPMAFLALYQARPYGVLALEFNPRSVKCLFMLLRYRGFDLALIPGDNRYSWLAQALDAKWIVAFAGDRPNYKNWPVDELIPYPGQPAAWGDMVAELVSGGPPKAFTPSDWPEPNLPNARSHAFEIPKSGYCVLHVGASSLLKLWDIDKWRLLAERMARKGLVVVWSAGPGEEKYVGAIDPAGIYPNYAGKLNLAQLWHLIKRAEFLVSPDTGIAHLGRIVNTPTVTLFGPGSAIICGAGDFWRESPYIAVTVDNFHCRNQQILFKRNISWVQRCGRSNAECATPACMHALEVAQVERAIDRLTRSDDRGALNVQ